MPVPIQRDPKKLHVPFKGLPNGSVFSSGGSYSVKAQNTKVLPSGIIPQRDPQLSDFSPVNLPVVELDPVAGDLPPLLYTLSQGNDPVLGPPFTPTLYQAYIYRDGRGALSPGGVCSGVNMGPGGAVVAPSAGVTRISWTVPCILANISVSEVNYAVTISFTNYLNFPAKTTAVAMLAVPGSIDYPDYRAVNAVSNNASTDSGATTATMMTNGDGTSTVTLSGGSYHFTPTLQYPTGPGAVLHWDDGQEVVIISITNTTTAIVNGGATKAAQQFTMYNTAAVPNLNFTFPSLANTYASVPAPPAFAASVYIRFTSTINGVQRVLISNTKGMAAPRIQDGPVPGVIQLSQQADGPDTNIIMGANESPDPTAIDSIGFYASTSNITGTIPDHDAIVNSIASLPATSWTFDSVSPPFGFYWAAAWWHSVNGRISGWSPIQHWTP